MMLLSCNVEVKVVYCILRYANRLSTQRDRVFEI